MERLFSLGSNRSDTVQMTSSHLCVSKAQILRQIYLANFIVSSEC